MQYFVLVLLIPVFMLCHTPKNSSDVIVTYEGHSDAEVTRDRDHDLHQSHAEIQEAIPKDPPTERTFVTERDEVIFVPNERERQIDDYLSNDEITVGNILKGGEGGRRNLDDIVRGKFNTETEPPKNSDIVFVSGKNNEQVEDPRSPSKKHNDAKKNEKRVHTKQVTKLYCTNLDCNKTSSPICGGKIEHNCWRYRLFLNECFFRKVNCGFNYQINRYTQVERSKCHNVSDQSFIQRPQFRPEPKLKSNEVLRNDARRAFSGRRSSNTNLDGQYCSHTCPITCPDDYKPECAISNTGEKRVFINHCTLDYNSCFYNIAWHKQPLSECIGSKTADLRQNRGFISWMHRIGIIDGKGRLAVSA